MRWWSFGGRTDVDSMVLLCDVDHGLVHEHDLVMTRRDGRLVVLTPDGRRIWGPADAAFTAGVGGVAGTAASDHSMAADDSTADPFTGVAPIDELAGRRPAVSSPGRVSGVTDAPHRETVSMARLLFPDGPPRLPDAMHVNGERMDMRYVVGVLMGNRDLERRLAAEARGESLVAA
jgi:hypothetical protein